MQKLILVAILLNFSVSLYANDKSAIERAVLDYIQSQHLVKPELMERGTDKKLVKRTYWHKVDGTEFVMEADHDAMVGLAARYNRNGDKFPEQPYVDIKIFDVDQRVASVKLTVDDWIDYMH